MKNDVFYDGILSPDDSMVVTNNVKFVLLTAKLGGGQVTLVQLKHDGTDGKTRWDVIFYWPQADETTSKPLRLSS